MGEVFREAISKREAALNAALMMQAKLAEQMPSDAQSDDEKLLDWVNRYGAAFRDIVEHDPELSERMAKGEVRPEDLVVIRALLDEYDLGEENHGDQPETDA